MSMKFPRTFHLPYSLGATNDDKMLKSVDHFVGKEVVVSEKLDGENCTMTSEVCHARSLDSKNHPSRDWVKQLHGQIKHEIPKNWRVVGENLLATHSIHYTSLPSYFLVFAIFDERNFCLSWDNTKECAELLGLKIVPELYRGIWNEEKIHKSWGEKSFYGPVSEGYVVRTVDGFLYEKFADHVAKMVRKNHVQTSEHWLNQKIIPNELA